jgi:hypothetical protein
MISLFKLLFKILVKPFYIINAGYFLLLFMLTFGILHPAEIILIHASLIKGIIHSNIFTWIILILWLLYNIKCILFCLRIIHRENDTVFFNLQAILPVKQYALLLACHCCLYLPVIVYSLFVIYMARQGGYILYAAGLIFFQLLMCVTGVYAYYSQINFTWKSRSLEKKSQANVQFFFNGRIRFHSYLLHYTFHSRKVIFLILKLVSIFLLNLILGSNSAHFDMRDFILVFMTVVMFHSLMVYFYVSFMEKDMAFTRNLPVSKTLRFLQFALSYCFILMPEFGFIIINGSKSISLFNMIMLFGIAVAQLMLFTAMLYLKSMKMKPYLQSIFFIFLVSSILMLSGSFTLIFVINTLLATVFFYRNFFSYEAEV